MKPDEAHKATDALLADLKKKISREYAQAVKDTQAKLDDYLRRFAIKDEKWRLMVANGKKNSAELSDWAKRVSSGEVTAKEFEAWKSANGIRTAEEYAEWRQGQIMIGKRWEEMRDALAQDYHNANVIARSMVDGYMPEVYALNHNYATFEVEKGALVDTSYTLYDRQTVERLIRDNPDLLPPPGKNMNARIAAGKDIRWQEGQIQSVTLQSILQGESIPNMAKRIAREMGETNHKATIRYARTAVTGAENAGRIDGYRRAETMGIEMRQSWVATLDGRTRHSHRKLDGETVPVGEKFSNGCRFPGDPNGPPEETWNCRCTLIAQLKGFERDVSDLNLRHTKNLGNMTYEEWKNAHATSERITKQEETGKAMAGAYIAEYKKAGKK